MSPNRDTGLKVLKVIFVALMVLSFILILQEISRAHDADLCEETAQQLEEWIEWETWNGVNSEVLEELRLLLLERREACRPHKERPVDSSNRRPPDYGSEVEQWRPLVAQFFGASKVETALCLIHFESRGDPTAYHSGSGASGLLQHLARYWEERSVKAGWAGADIFDPTANVAVAAWLQSVGGWRHWSPWNRGLCRGL